MSKKSTILVTFGTRPEWVKLSQLVYKLADHPDFNLILAPTGQHQSLLDGIYKWLPLPKTEIRRGVWVLKKEDLTDFSYGDTCDVTKRFTTILHRLSIFKETVIDPTLLEYFGVTEIDAVIVQGDAASACAGALFGAYHQIPVYHVEAGLRTYNFGDPYPEEINREIISVLADVHYAPTTLAESNLVDMENVSAGKVVITGNTGLDAVKSLIESGHVKPYEISDGFDRGLSKLKIVTVTMHRRESIGPGISDFIGGLGAVAEQHEDLLFLILVHANPEVQDSLGTIGDLPESVRNRVLFIPPLDYASMLGLLQASHLVVTDSGGLVEECSYLGVPVAIARRNTERFEAVESGGAELVGVGSFGANDVGALLDKGVDVYRDQCCPFGDGTAANKVVEDLEKRLLKDLEVQDG